MTLGSWDDEEVIRGFAGEEIETAVSYPEDDRPLVDCEETVVHVEAASGG